jgi:hypothetical protein
MKGGSIRSRLPVEVIQLGGKLAQLGGGRNSGRIGGEVSHLAGEVA